VAPTAPLEQAASVIFPPYGTPLTRESVLVPLWLRWLLSGLLSVPGRLGASPGLFIPNAVTLRCRPRRRL